MSEIIYESVSRTIKRKIYLTGKSAVESFSDKLINQEVYVSGVVVGGDFDDAMKGLAALEKKCVAAEEMKILDMIGKMVFLRSIIQADSCQQQFTITLKIDEKERKNEL